MPAPVQVATDRPWCTLPLHHLPPISSDRITSQLLPRPPYQYTPYVPYNWSLGYSFPDSTTLDDYAPNSSGIPALAYRNAPPPLLTNSRLAHHNENAIPPPVGMRIPTKWSLAASATQEQSYLSTPAYCEPDWLGTIREEEFDHDYFLSVDDHTRDRVSTTVSDHAGERERSTTFVGDELPPTGPVMWEPEHFGITSSESESSPWIFFNQTIVNGQLFSEPAIVSSPPYWHLGAIIHHIEPYTQVQDAGSFWLNTQDGLLVHERDMGCRECVRQAWEAWNVTNPGFPLPKCLLPVPMTPPSKPTPNYAMLAPSSDDQASKPTSQLDIAIKEVMTSWSRPTPPASPASSFGTYDMWPETLQLPPIRTGLHHHPAVTPMTVESDVTLKDFLRECDTTPSPSPRRAKRRHDDILVPSSPTMSFPAPPKLRTRASAYDNYRNPLGFPNNRVVEERAPKRMRLWDGKIMGERHV